MPYEARKDWSRHLDEVTVNAGTSIHTSGTSPEMVWASVDHLQVPLRNCIFLGEKKKKDYTCKSNFGCKSLHMCVVGCSATETPLCPLSGVHSLLMSLHPTYSTPLTIGGIQLVAKCKPFLSKTLRTDTAKFELHPAPTRYVIFVRGEPATSLLQKSKP